MESDKKIIEIGGVKMEVDLRYARTVDTYRVGDNVKVLKKEYNDKFTSYPGVIIGFDDFCERPTITIAYLDAGYNSSNIEFLYYNKDSADIEICPMVGEEVIISKATVVEQLNAAIKKEEHDLAELKMKKEYFLKHFNQYFEEKEVKTA